MDFLTVLATFKEMIAFIAMGVGGTVWLTSQIHSIKVLILEKSATKEDHKLLESRVRRIENSVAQKDIRLSNIEARLTEVAKKL